MRTRRGLTILEVLIASSMLLLMLGLATLAMTGYLRSYRTYTEKGRRLRSSAQALDAVCRHLRSAELLYHPDPTLWDRGFSLEDQPVELAEHGAGRSRLVFRQGQVFCEGVQPVLSLGRCASLRFVARGRGRQRRLVVQCDELETELSLRGIP